MLADAVSCHPRSLQNLPEDEVVDVPGLLGPAELFPSAVIAILELEKNFPRIDLSETNDTLVMRR